MKSKVWLGILISAVFLWLTLRKIDYHELLLGLGKADYVYLIPAVLIHLFQVFLRAKRWGVILEPVKKIGSYRLFSATSIGFMANNILPARIGEVIKAFILGKEEKISVSTSFATIILERLLDLSIIFIFMFFVLYGANLPFANSKVEIILKQGGATLLFVFLSILVLLFYFKSHQKFFKEIAHSIVRPLSLKMADKISSLLDSFVSGLSIVKKGKHLFFLTFYSFIIWSLSALPIHLILISFGYVLPFTVSLFILVILALTVAIPSAPGFIGTFHYACAMGLELFKIPQGEALSIAIVLHAINFFPVTLLGFYFLWKNKLSLSDMERLEESR